MKKMQRFLFAAVLMLLCIGVSATSLTDLNFEITSSTTAVPTSYTYSTANTPSIKTQNNIKCIIISDGGGSTAPTFNGTSAPSGGKRWMAFSPDVNCSAKIYVMSNKKKFYIQSENGEFASYTNTANAVQEFVVTGFQANKWYAMCGASSQVYITKIEFTATSGGEVTPPAPTTYTITYNANGHGTAPAAFTGTSIPNPLPTLTASGYTFGGWFTDQACTTAATPGATLTANITLYAKWTEQSGTDPQPTTYTITYNANGHGTAPAAFTGTSIPNPLPKITATGYTFGGWFTDQACTTAATPGAALTANITLYAKWTEQSVTPPTPPTTTLTLHVPEVYETPKDYDGYGTPLTVFGGREYEVYYAGRDANSALTITTTPAIKTDGICSVRSSTGCKAADGWIEVSEPLSSPSTYTPAAVDEFATGSSAIHKIQGGYYKLHIQGYDQFSLYAMDNNADKSKGKYIEVYIDGVLQNMTLSTTATVRRFSLSTGEHLIEAKGLGSSNDQVIGFSLRLAEEPRTKWVSGNDSTQIIYQTLAPKPVTYFTKYNSRGRTELIWDGAQATGISLVPGNSSSIGDTLILGGTAQCPSGVYRYHVVAYNAQNQETSRASGKFTVASKIDATSDTSITVWEKSAMSPVTFRYYSINDADVTYAWVGATPAGIRFVQDNANKTLKIEGTPTSVGTFRYTVSIANGNTITGTIIVESNSPTIVPGATKTMLYLYKSQKTAGLFSYLTTKYSYFARPAGSAMAASEYTAYDFIVISEDVDANNEEVLNIIRSIAKPVLNMKVFAYTTSRLGWGDPDNGSITSTSMHVTQPTHPIFAGLSGSDIAVISEVAGNRGLMCADIYQPGGICLATTPKRGDDYESDGEAATFIHEVPAAQRGAKYLLLPIGNTSAANLTANGKKLVDNMITYLCGNTSFTASPELRITSFIVNGVAGVIDEQKLEINLDMPVGTTLDDLKEVTPQITLADASTHVTPSSGATVDLSDTHYGVKFTVSDYINRKIYTVRARVITALDDETTAEGLWMAGNVLHNDRNAWVNIYSVSGNLITTTNSDYDFEQLPKGMYLVVSENSTLKVVR